MIVLIVIELIAIMSTPVERSDGYLLAGTLFTITNIILTITLINFTDIMLRNVN